MMNFGSFTNPAKLVMIFDMLAGRLEDVYKRQTVQELGLYMAGARKQGKESK